MGKATDRKPSGKIGKKMPWRAERKKRLGILKKAIGIELICILTAVCLLSGKYTAAGRQEGSADTSGQEQGVLYVQTASSDTQQESEQSDEEETAEQKKDYIKWVDFNVTQTAMQRALRYDLESYGTECHLDWIVLLAYAGCRGGGEFSKKSLEYIDTAVEALTGGQSVEEFTKDLQYYDYYYEAYSAVLGGFVGEYQTPDENGEYQTCYGVKVFSPIAGGFGYSDYDDFGSSRSYGYSRPHLGHDMMGMIGTPIIAIESGYVEALGWNQYGGWRIGIRSFDGKRYYYYAHLRQNYPYAEGLQEGSVVTAGDVIGYMGHTGYSATENVNNIETVHLHWGMELIFDASQKDSNNEIWIDCYELTKFLCNYRSTAQKVGDTREWIRTTPMIDPAVENYLSQ